ncbi:ABC transporter substrate-binding protein [Neptuniibacter marinus]|uniref:ABC transporter substrate-binding protein n=1 Tax=Neptuniibacter marinus TaxID=1806670 RepID=UPI0008358B71|nr:ABC transporter substrate-binding protein [Neptuniibacter marinus]
MDGTLKISLPLCIAVLALFSSIIHGGQHLSPLPKIKIAVSTTPLSAPVYIAKVKGYFINAGLDVSILEIDGGDQCFTALQTGKADMATVSNSVIMFNSFKHSNFEVISSFAKSDNDLKIVSFKQKNIRTAHDLRGRTVGLVKGSASEYFFHLWLSESEIDIAEVDVKSYFANELPTVLEQGKVDAISVWEPFAYQINKSNNDIEIMNTKGLYNLSFNLIGLRDNPLLTSTQTLGNQKQTKQKITEALNKAVRFIAINPERSQLILRRHLKLSQHFIDWVWQDYTFKLLLNEPLLSSVKNQAQWAIDRELVPQENTPDFSKIILLD